MNIKKNRVSAVEISAAEFKRIGYELIDNLAVFYTHISEQPVTSAETPKQINDLVGQSALPEKGLPASTIISNATELLLNHSLLNGHPKFFGYITSSPTQIGAFADLLAAAVNPNVGANVLSPMATAIEKQTIKWLTEFIGLSPGYGGVIVSGGNMANLTAFLAARTAKAPKNLKENGLMNLPEMVFYCSKATHTWIDKAATLFGHGTDSIRWIECDEQLRMDTNILEKTIKADIANNKKPFLIIANAGDVSTGVVDNLALIGDLCKTYNLWFHIDGAYGIPAAVLPVYKELFSGMEEADSIAMDPHKWLYAPLEAGCVLVKDPQTLIDSFSAHPVYYNFSNEEEEPVTNFYEYGLQNSRGFKALKVWMALQQAGKSGYVKMLTEDIELAKLLFTLAEKHPELEAITNQLSITTLRYLPLNFIKNEGKDETFLNGLNEKLLNELQQGGEIFLSNAVVANKYCLRACIVNYRTDKNDIEEVIEIIVREGRKIYKSLSEK